MATVIGLMQAAKAYLPHAIGKRGRRDAVDLRTLTPPAKPGASVAEVIEQQIIPRLMVAHRGEMPVTLMPRGEGPRIDPREASAFAPLALEVEANTLLDHVEIFLRRGVEIDTVFVELLAPAARHLGEMWDDDRCDFVDVTMGLWRLQEIVRELSSRTSASVLGGEDARRALFASMPGDQHSFGTIIIEDIFRRHGWATDIAPACATPDLLDMVARSRFDLLGLTVSLDTHIERLPSLLLAIRSVSRNPRLCIMLGGRVLATDPGLVLRVGADGTASDAQTALDMADRLVAVPARGEVHSA